MTGIHIRYSEIVADVTGHVRLPARVKDNLSFLESRIEEFVKILLNEFDEYCTSPYTLNYHLLDHMVKKYEDSGRYLYLAVVLESILMSTSSKIIKDFAKQTAWNDGNCRHAEEMVEESAIIREEKRMMGSRGGVTND